MKKLFLDDVRMPWESGNYMLPVDVRPLYRLGEWDIVRNYDEFVAWFEQNDFPDVISFDHDLAAIHYDPSTWTEGFEYDEKTGYDCAKYFVNLYNEKGNGKQIQVLCHSMNPIGKENILKLFR